MARTDPTKGQVLWHAGGAEEDSCFREGARHLHLVYDEEEDYHKYKQLTVANHFSHPLMLRNNFIQST